MGASANINALHPKFLPTTPPGGLLGNNQPTAGALHDDALDDFANTR
jgi:hypothetical protein